MFLVSLPVYAVIIHVVKVLFCNFYLEDDGSPIIDRIYPGPVNATESSHRSIGFETISNPYWAFLLGITIVMHGVILIDIIWDKYPKLHPANIWKRIKTSLGFAASNEVAPQEPAQAWEEGRYLTEY